MRARKGLPRPRPSDGAVRSGDGRTRRAGAAQRACRLWHLAAAAILFIVARGGVVASIDLFARGIEASVTSIGVAPLDSSLDPKKNSERLLPAQLAQPRDQR